MMNQVAKHSTQHVPLTEENFRATFPNLRSLIQQEWPQLDDRTLRQTRGDLDRVIDLVAEQTDHTRTYVRRQLSELQDAAIEDMGQPRQEGRMQKALRNLEQRRDEVTQNVRHDMLPRAQSSMRENLLITVLVSCVVGVVVGFMMRSLAPVLGAGVIAARERIRPSATSFRDRLPSMSMVRERLPWG